MPAVQGPGGLAHTSAGRAAAQSPGLLPRPAMRLATLNLIVAVCLVAAANLPFWRTVLSTHPQPGFVIGVAALVLILVNLLLTLMSWGRMAKPALSAVLLTSAAATYFMHRYGIVFDRDMIANVVETDLREALELLNPGFIVWMLAFGVLPCLAVQRVRIVRGTWTSRLAETAGVLVVSLLVVGTVAATMYQPLASLVRNHRELHFQLTPINIVGALGKYAVRNLDTQHDIEVVGADARRTVPAALAGKRRITIIVVGETARAANFSLLGYARDTNPRLARSDVIALGNVHSCGTATATSVPCMFQDVGRDGYRAAMAKSRENLLDVLQRAGVEVLWRDNNSGCKHVCDRVPQEDLAHLELPELCRDGHCYDEVLLHGLQQRIDRFSGDGVIVLHMLGSHGPAYSKRYPRAYATFGPACESSQLEKCSRDAIVNAYDNTIRYTDHVLSAVIDLLERNAQTLDSAFLYVSDHGESLGEHGLYLHGLPYAIAPDEQTHVPMVAWLSEGYRQRIDMRCVRNLAGRPFSHDNLFHSVLGLMQVSTTVYKRERDLFATCARVSG